MRTISSARIAVALSGGVDSAVAAMLLKQQGANIFAVFMKNWEDDDTASDCHDKVDLIAAAAAADALDIDLSVVNFAAQYKQEVFSPFLESLRQGLTPNPDVLCNSKIKFDAFRRHAVAMGADFIATGHYANVRQLNNEWQLLKGEDAAKDQSYFLHQLHAEQLAIAHFPLGGWHKTEVRVAAYKAGLNNWARKDSTGICFVGKRRFNQFLARYLPHTPGSMQTPTGKVVGQHCGLAFYTIGQRQGLGIGGSGAPWFVITKRPQQNVLVVSQDDSLLYDTRVTIANTHWISGKPPPVSWVFTARLRHQQPPASCTLLQADNNVAEIVFAKPQRAPAPGQYAVLYDGNLCLGGGVIQTRNDT